MTVRTLKDWIDSKDPVRLDPISMVFDFPVPTRLNLTQQRRMEALIRAIPTTASVYARDDRVVVKANHSGDWDQNILMVLAVKQAIKTLV